MFKIQFTNPYSEVKLYNFKGFTNNTSDQVTTIILRSGLTKNYCQDMQLKWCVLSVAVGTRSQVHIWFGLETWTRWVFVELWSRGLWVWKISEWKTIAFFYKPRGCCLLLNKAKTKGKLVHFPTEFGVTLYWKMINKIFPGFLSDFSIFFHLWFVSPLVFKY